MCAALFVGLGGLLATYVAHGKRHSASEEDDRESEASADPSVLPVEASGDDLRLADRARVRPNELDPRLGNRAGLLADEFDSRLANRGRQHPRRRARQWLRADDLDSVTTEDELLIRQARRRIVRALDDLGCARLAGDALVDASLCDRGRKRREGEPEGDPLESHAEEPRLRAAR
jgi:hypothetical protein